MNTALLEIVSDYLLSSFGQTTATGLSSVLDSALSHDQVTRFLNQGDYDSKLLWQHVKKAVREVERDGVLIFDDTIQEKPYTDENELVCWHFDHTQGRSVKGINILRRSDIKCLIALLYSGLHDFEPICSTHQP
jgi:DDE superfamily endonuclease